MCAGRIIITTGVAAAVRSYDQIRFVVYTGSSSTDRDQYFIMYMIFLQKWLLQKYQYINPIGFFRYRH